MSIEWKLVKDSWTGEPIGAVGFIDNRIAVITAFHDDKDLNQDGRVSLSERFLSMFSMRGRAVAKVANHAYADPDILMRDPTLYNLRGRLTAQFAAGLVAEGVYKAYFSRSISALSGAAAKRLTGNVVKAFVIRKGMEKAVEDAYVHLVH